MIWYNRIGHTINNQQSANKKWVCMQMGWVLHKLWHTFRENYVWLTHINLINPETSFFPDLWTSTGWWWLSYSNGGVTWKTAKTSRQCSINGGCQRNNLAASGLAFSKDKESIADGRTFLARVVSNSNVFQPISKITVETVEAFVRAFETWQSRCTAVKTTTRARAKTSNMANSLIHRLQQPVGWWG